MHPLSRTQLSVGQRRLLIGISLAVFFVGIGVFSLAAFAATYTERVLPGIQVGQIDIGGMDRTELRSFLRNMSDKLANDGMDFVYTIGEEQRSFTLYPVNVSESGAAEELVYIDVDDAVESLVAYGKQGGVFGQVLGVLSHSLKKEQVAIHNIVVNRSRLLEELRGELGDHETQPQNAGVRVTGFSPLGYELVDPVVGYVFDYEQAIDDMVSQWGVLRPPYVEVSQTVTEPTVLPADVVSILDRLPTVFDHENLDIVYTDPITRREVRWPLSQEQLASWLVVQPHDGRYVFGLDSVSTTAYIADVVSPSVSVAAQDAKFEVDENGRVVEFQGSRPGIDLDLEKTYAELNTAFIQRTLHDEGVAQVVSVSVKQTEATVATGEVNDLGITEVLGVGISDYSNSPRNRILNIRNAVNKLNGVIVQPGEEFSTIEHTKPYTLDGGYYPELVIKGDELKPEVAGGLCQIGTTLFRMAMNSGLPITQRRNHSLVVFHYNDPVNGLPGTDATIYDPAPDFRFKNDTGNAILIQTYMKEDTEELVFTVWGTSDGRKGSYTHPVVSRWIPAPRPVEVPTTKLAPGQRNCQSAFRGADASFTYTVERPDGSKEEEVFESHYRPLPQICLVGVAEETPPCEEAPDGSTTCPVDAPNQTPLPEENTTTTS